MHKMPQFWLNTRAHLSTRSYFWWLDCWRLRQKPPATQSSPWTWRQYVPSKRWKPRYYRVCKRSKPIASAVTVLVYQTSEYSFNARTSHEVKRYSILLNWGEKWGKGNAAGWGEGRSDRPTDLQLPKRLLSPLRDANQAGAPNFNFTCIKISCCSWRTTYAVVRSIYPAS